MINRPGGRRRRRSLVTPPIGEHVVTQAVRMGAAGWGSPNLAAAGGGCWRLLGIARGCWKFVGGFGLDVPQSLDALAPSHWIQRRTFFPTPSLATRHAWTDPRVGGRGWPLVVFLVTSEGTKEEGFNYRLMLI